MLFRRLDIAPWIEQGIRPNDRGWKMAKYIYGGDTETLDGSPMTFQFFSLDTPRPTEALIWTSPERAAKDFARWVRSLQRKVEHVVYVHNLEFDLIEFLWMHHARLVGEGSGEFEFEYEGLHVAGVYGKPTFCRVEDAHDRSVLLIDSYSFFRGSLAHAAALFCPHLPKLERPEGLGQRQFSSRDAGFCEYAMRDAVVTYWIGRSIEQAHQDFDLRQTVSVADMAARVFRHRFLDYTIPQPSRSITEAALLSYHGGKNNLAAEPGWYTGVSALDISSAYPHAMAELPAFSNARLYRRFAATPTRRKRLDLPRFGVYQVTGVAAECAWPCLFSHAFKPIAGRFEGVWIAGFELQEALDSGELRLDRISGYYYDAERDRKQPALQGFVREFYARKEAEPDKVKRYMYKLILNSLSGKFVQTRKTQRVSYVDLDGTVSSVCGLVAGGLFHSFVATQITAHTRARIHQLEHSYKALHTATDGIFTQAPTNAPAKALHVGGLTCEARGELLLVRNKLYILFGGDGKALESQAFKGKFIAKYALHGFLGTVHDLEKLIARGRRRYTAQRVNRLKESLRRGLTPNKFEQRDYVLKVGPLAVRPGCKDIDPK